MAAALLALVAAATVSPVLPVAAAAADGGSTAPATATDGGSIGIRLVDAPTARQDDPRAHRYIVDYLKPGTGIDRSILVANHSDVPQVVDVYPAAASIDKGEFLFAADQTPNELTSWITPARQQVRLDAGAESSVPVHIGVPPDATGGEHYAVIWAAVSSGPQPSTGIVQVHRVGVRVYLGVGPGGEPASDFAIGAVTAARSAGGVASATISVTNTGGRAIDMSGTVALAGGPAGVAAGPFAVSTGTTLGPGEQGDVLVQFPADIPNGPWTMHISLQSGTVKRSADVSVTFPDPGQRGQAASLLSGVGSSWWLFALAAVVLAGLVVAALIARRRAA